MVNVWSREPSGNVSAPRIHTIVRKWPTASFRTRCHALWQRLHLKKKKKQFPPKHQHQTLSPHSFLSLTKPSPQSSKPQHFAWNNRYSKRHLPLHFHFHKNSFFFNTFLGLQICGFLSIGVLWFWVGSS